MRSSKNSDLVVPDKLPLPTKIVVTSEVHRVDLGRLARFTPSTFLLGEAGTEPYRLLAHLSLQLPDESLVADLGTLQAASAVALSFNPDVFVKTYDTVDHISSGRPGNVDDVPDNIMFRNVDCLEHVDEFISAALIHLDIDPHDGIQEQLLLNTLTGLGYRGLLVCDDINLSPGMQQFWASIAQKKLDVTQYGHWSGTGIVVFDPTAIDAEIL